MIQQVERINPELHCNPLRQFEVLRQRRVPGVGWRPKTIANRSISDCAQLEAIQSVAIRVNPLEALKAGITARLAGYDVGQLNSGTASNARRVIDIRYPAYY